MEGVQIALVVGGLLVGLLGVHVERPAVMLVGFGPGVLLGATFAPRVFTGVEEPTATVVTAVAALVAGVLAAQLAWSAWVLVHAVPGFVAGVAVSAPVVGVSLSNPEPGAGLALVAGAGLVGAMLAWRVRRVFVAAFTGLVGAAMVSVGVFGERVYVPTARALLRRPEPELRVVVESLRDFGEPTVALAVGFAVVQLASLARGDDEDTGRRQRAD